MQSLKERLLTTDRSIVDIGPQFKVTSQMNANFGIKNLNAAVGLNYNLSGVNFIFPPQGGSDGTGIAPSTKRESCLYLLLLIAAALRPTHINAT